MKKVFSLFVGVLVIVVGLFSFVGCSPKEPLVIKESDTYIVINVSNEQMDITDTTTLVDYMNSLKDDGQLTFEINNGMVSSVNGIDNPADWSSCWMLYTSDSDSSNTAWGTIEYNGNVYGSAVLGAESLIIKDGCMYIWVFQSF
mgnify:CR=1 FL=1